jgi:tetratricopeptide (TPR) repeat protein
LGWGLKVSDPGGIKAAKKVYGELSRGKSVVDAVNAARRELTKGKLADELPLEWSLLRFFTDGTPLSALVTEGQEWKPKLRELQYTYLANSQVKVLTKGFVGRRRQIQRALHCLKKDDSKVGVFLHGTGGLGKSCLAGKLCERLKSTLVVVHGKLNAVTFEKALKDAFIRAEDKKGLELLGQELEMPEKVQWLCSSVFKDKKYVIVLDDFEKNMSRVEKEDLVLSAEAAPVFEALLYYLPYTGKKSQVIVTSRYEIPCMVNGEDIAQKRLEFIGLTSFRDADERKKVSELKEIVKYSDKKVRADLIKAGRGNPRLMEEINDLLKLGKRLDVNALLKRIEGKQEEFVQRLLLREIMERQPEGFQMVMKRAAVYGVPVLREGIHLVCEGVGGWDLFVDTGVKLSLIEQDKRGDLGWYWVTPLLREEIFEELKEKERMECHKRAVAYYKLILSLIDGYDPVYASELVDNAVKCNMEKVALEEGDKLVMYLRGTLAYQEAVDIGEYIFSEVSEGENEEFAEFLSGVGLVYYDVGDNNEAIKCFEKALKIDKKIYGEEHPDVARRLNNLGGAWYALGDAKKAIEYYEKALKIDKKIYGEEHPDVATMLNNLGGAWYALGDAKKAIEYYEKALKIDKKIYGEEHPSVARDLNNLGLAWDALGDAKKAIEYYEKALKILKGTYGEIHPYVATTLGNIGVAWLTLKDIPKAIKYIEKSHIIFQKILGDQHPDTQAAKKVLDMLKKEVK